MLLILGMNTGVYESKRRFDSYGFSAMPKKGHIALISGVTRS